MAKKSMGGFLPIELRKAKEFYDDDAIRLNSARNAIVLSVLDGKYKKVYIPLYLCPSVADTLKKNGIIFEYYNINSNLEPDSVEITADECILIVNYFGFMNEKRLYAIKRQYKNIIIDNTQAFYMKPISGAYNVYSCRKFFGVSDGAYLIKNGIKKYKFPKDYSCYRGEYLLESLEKGTNVAYQHFLESEDNIASNEILEMSDLTKSILDGIDYEYIRQKRINNFNYLHKKLAGENTFSIPLDYEYCPMIYPLVIYDDRLRKYLIENHIYVSQWWKFCIEHKQTNQIEKELSQYLLPLPIDQRYNIEDMDYLSQCILDYIRKER